MISKRGNLHPGWERPCHLDDRLLEQRVVAFDLDEFNFVEVAETFFDASDLELLHRKPLALPAATPPQLRRAQVQAQVGNKISKAERKGARTHAKQYEQTETYKMFLKTYSRFVRDWVMPQFGNVPLLYQRKPILRVVLPGSVAPTAMHADADYFHDANELNYWVPLTPCGGNNSLWSESKPGAGDFAPFVARPGEAVRWYGNRCRHYTVPNPPDGAVRVSFDFRVIPFHLFQPPDAQALRMSKHSLNPGISKKGYYALAAAEDESPAIIGARRRAWREAAPGRGASRVTAGRASTQATAEASELA